MPGDRLELSQTRDGIYLVHDAAGRLLGSFYDEGDGWWATFPSNGAPRRLYAPDGDPEELVRRLFRP